MKTNYVFVDFENVQPENLDCLNQEMFKVFLFIGEKQTKLPRAVVMAKDRLGERAKYVEICGTGPNALDFHIAYYIGKIAAEDANVFFHIVSKDTGFDPLIKHLKMQNVLCDRVGSIQDIPVLAANAAVESSVNEQVAFAKKRLNGIATCPRSRKTLTSHINAMFSKLLPKERIDDIVEELFHDGTVREDGKRLVYAFEE